MNEDLLAKLKGRSFLDENVGKSKVIRMFVSSTFTGSFFFSLDILSFTISFKINLKTTY